jgi:hypothetical protein
MFYVESRGEKYEKLNIKVLEEANGVRWDNGQINNSGE